MNELQTSNNSQWTVNAALISTTKGLTKWPCHTISQKSSAEANFLQCSPQQVSSPSTWTSTTATSTSTTTTSTTITTTWQIFNNWSCWIGRFKNAFLECSNEEGQKIKKKKVFFFHKNEGGGFPNSNSNEIIVDASLSIFFDKIRNQFLFHTKPL